MNGESQHDSQINAGPNLGQDKIDDIRLAASLGFTAIEAADLLSVDENDALGVYEQVGMEMDEGAGADPAGFESSSKGIEAPTGDNATSKNKGPRRGHFAKHIKHDLASRGKLNAKKPMTPEQKRARKRKRKK